MRENNVSVRRPPVTVRAWGDEPVKLVLYRIENNRCYVGSENSQNPIGLPCDQVFAFDVDTMAILSTAFQHGDKRRLGELLANISVDDYACNRYQDMVECSHDQKHVANSESAPSSNAR